MISTPVVPVVALLLSSLAGTSLAQGTGTGQQIVFDSIHNASSIVGTWSSGSKGVQTGAGFVNPANESFTYPKTTGISYSFTGDGFYEIARYRFNSNGSEPNCITGVVNWVHGTYDLLGNGSIITTPFGDGFQQIQDPCAAVSNFIENYNDTELYQSWRIFQDPTFGFKLHLFQFDGSPLAPQFQVSPNPIMLPTQLLRNVTVPVSTTTSPGGLTIQNNLAEPAGNDAAPSRRSVGGALTVSWVMSLVSLLL